MPHQPTAPPDGGYGWVVVISGMIVMVFSGSIFHTSGVFLVEFVEYFQHGVEKAAWIGAFSGAICNASGPLAAALTKKLGTRIVVMIGGFLCSLGIILSVFAQSLQVLYFTFGILVGFGLGLPVVANVVLINKYFNKRHAIANGLFFTGVSIGILLSPPLFHMLIEIYGWRGAMLIIGAMNANVIVCGALMKPYKNVELQKNTSLKKVTLTDNNCVNVSCASHNDTEVSVHSSKTRPAHQQQDATLSEEQPNCDLAHEDTHSTCSSTDKNIAIVAKCKRRPRMKHNIYIFISFIGLHLFVRKPSFSFICFGQFLEGFGNGTALSHLIARAITSGTSKFDATLLLTLFGCGGLLGRLLNGFMINLKIISPTRLLGLAIIVYGLTILANPLTDVYGVLATLAAVLGLSQGVYQALIPVSLRECVGEKDVGMALGLDYFCMGIGYLLGPPCSGWLFDVTGNYTLAFFVTGAMVIIGGILIVFSPYVGSCNVKRCKKYKYNMRDSTVELAVVDSVSTVSVDTTR
ncbi:monocarboxylate transporter 12-like [Glandiceps talaboti]